MYYILNSPMEKDVQKTLLRRHLKHLKGVSTYMKHSQNVLNWLDTKPKSQQKKGK